MEKKEEKYAIDYSRMGKASILDIELQNPFVKSLFTSKFNSHLPDTEEKFFKIFLISLKKTNRSSNDCQIITNFLQGVTEFIKMIQKSLENYLDLLTFISQTIKYEFLERNKILFRTGKFFSNRRREGRQFLYNSKRRSDSPNGERNKTSYD